MLKKYAIPLIIFFILLIMLASPDICITAAKNGLLLWFNKVLPSLLPFMILINILSNLNSIKKISNFATPLTKKMWGLPGSSLFAFIMGLIAGYPMGGKVVRELYKNKALSHSEAQKTLCFTNNCSPLFIIGTIGTIMLHDTSIGYFLVFIHFLSAIIMSFILASYETTPFPTPQPSQGSKKSVHSFSSLFNESVKNSMDTIVYVGGYIIFFSVIAGIIYSSPITLTLLKSPILHNMPSSYFFGLLSGILELANGVSMVCTSSNVSIYSISILAFITGFGGICIHFQTSYILDGCSFSFLPYIISKVLQGILSFLLSGLCYPLFLLYTTKTSFAFPLTWCLSLVVLILISLYGVKMINNFHHLSTHSISKKYIGHYQK